MIKNFLVGLSCGIVLTLTLLSYDPWVHKKVGDYVIENLTQVYHCKVQGEVISLNFFSPSITLSNLSFTALDDSWSWRVEKYRSGFNWITSFFSRDIGLWISMEHLNAHAKGKDGQIALASHIQDLLRIPDSIIPITLKHAMVYKGELHLDDYVTTHLYFNSEARRLSKYFRIKLHLSEGSTIAQEKEIANHYSGGIIVDSSLDAQPIIKVRLDCRADLVGLSENPTCFITGIWDAKDGQFSIRSLDQSLIINPIIVNKKNNKPCFEAHGHFPLSYVMNYIAPSYAILSGSCQMTVEGIFENEGLLLDARIDSDNVAIPGFTKPLVTKSSLHKRADQWNGALHVSSLFAGKGTWHWNDSIKQGSIALNNTELVAIPYFTYWQIKPRDLSCNIQMTPETIATTYAATVSNSLLDTSISSTGSGMINLSDALIDAQGVIHDRQYDIKGNYRNAPYLEQVSYHNSQHKRLLFIEKTDKNTLTTNIDFALLRTIIHNMYQYDMQGEGILSCQAQVHDKKALFNISLEDANIRLANTYNFINGLTGSIELDWERKHLFIKDMHSSLHTGTLSLLHGALYWNNDGSLRHISLPFLLDRCLVTIRRDLFTMVSGMITITADDVFHPYVKGSLILDRSQLKENIFALALQKRLFAFTDSWRDSGDFSLMGDISVETKDPIRIDTDFLRANAAVSLRISQNMKDPLIEGNITLHSGVLNFPYKPLYINKGLLTFLPGQSMNPLIELVARNKMKNHNVALHVTGSLRDQLVLLESTPPLTEEQIVSLLLVGSPEESISAIVPSLLVQNITSLIFSTNQARLLEKYMHPWMKQFSIRFRPSLSDQSGRGGLRGGIEIDVNDRWRALIEKNFTLSEDTRFELEYTLSDDVMFRMIRDERKDVGAEVEMKWKF